MTALLKAASCRLFYWQRRAAALHMEHFLECADSSALLKSGVVHTRKGCAVVVPKAGNPLRSKLRVELTLRG